jgi:integrase
MSANHRIPLYRKHKQSGQAIVTLRDGFGVRRDVLLGKFGTKASKEAYGRVIAEWEARGRKLTGPQADISVNELILQYWEWARTYYQHPTEISNITMSCRPWKYLYGEAVVRDFGPLSLKSVRELMVTGYDHPKFGPQPGLARKNINDRIGRIKRIVKWGVENELVPASAYHAVQAIPGLRRGKTEAREAPKVKPVPQAFVDAVMPHVSAPVKAMIQLQEATAMRPGEVVIMRGIDLDMSGRVWVYRPEKHKNEHRDIEREIYLGPKAQAIIRPFLKPDVEAFLFSPREAREERFLLLRSLRKAKVQPSQLNRKMKNPKKLPGARYTVGSFRRAIKYACATAEVPEWSPNRLRHNAATNLRKEYGIELARIILGHTTAFTTEIYAEADRQQAMEVMAKIG